MLLWTHRAFCVLTCRQENRHSRKRCGTGLLHLSNKPDMSSTIHTSDIAMRRIRQLWNEKARRLTIQRSAYENIHVSPSRVYRFFKSMRMIRFYLLKWTSLGPKNTSTTPITLSPILHPHPPKQPLHQRPSPLPPGQSLSTQPRSQ